MGVTFPSRIDRPLALLGMVAPLTLMGVLFTPPGRTGAAHALSILVPLLVAALVAWIVWSTYYEFEHEALLVRSGPFCWRIPLHSIDAVSETRSVRSGPALSMDRLAISYDHGRVLLISPADKAGFLQLLYRRVPHLARSAAP